MNITFKLYAGLSQYLPEGSARNAINLNITTLETAYSIIEKFNIPRESVHLVLLNGIYLDADERENFKFKEGDILAIWPPVAGG